MDKTMNIRRSTSHICVTIAFATMVPPALGQSPPSVDDADHWRITGQYPKAIDAYTQLLDDPDARIAAACGLATCCLETGRLKDARTALTDVQSDGQGSSAWHASMAAVLKPVGHYAEAIAHAQRAIDLNANNMPARYLLGRLYETVGRRDEAIKTYRYFDRLILKRLPRSAENLTAAASGFLRYSVLTGHPNLSNRTIHTLQELYQPAYERVDRTYWPARVAAADLLRSKSKRDLAEEDYQAALAINDNLATAHIGLGWLALGQWDFEKTDHQIALAKQRNPNAPDVFHLEAALRLTERRYQQAKTVALAALDINPNDIAALGYAAAAATALNEPQQVTDFQARAYAVSPAPAAFHQIVADTLSALRQYSESEKQFQLAIKADPTDPHPRTELGLMYMQWGDEASARVALAAAWQIDDFDARTFNTLGLLDKLAAFDKYETEHFTIKYDSEKDAVLPLCYADYLESIYEEICEDYDATLTTKTTIEFLPTHRMFGVRITGKPWIHTIGACTGSVIALDAPRRHAELKGPYNVANVLRHEFTHTVTLAVTRNRIAHWFTEGLAVLQEDQPRTPRWATLLAEAVRTDDLFTLQTIDWGFIRPKRHTDRQLAYAQSEWMCEYIIERFGYDAINRMLGGFSRKQSQKDVFQGVLGLDTQQFDDDFDKWATEQVAFWSVPIEPPADVDGLRAASRADESDPTIKGQLARAEFAHGNLDRALAAARAGLKLDENNKASLTALGEILLAMRSSMNDSPQRTKLDQELEPAMRRLVKIDDERPVAHSALASIELDRGNHDAAIHHLERLEQLVPGDPAAHKGLAGIYLAANDDRRALPHLLELARIEDRDADVPATIAAMYVKQHRTADARYWYQQSIYIDPFSVDTHLALADVCAQTAADRCTARQYQILATLQPSNLSHLEAAANAFHKLGDVTAARRYAVRAIRIDPTSPVRSLIPPTQP